MRLVFVRPGEPLPVADLVILPGSKATIADLKFFREQGWDIDLAAHARRGGRVLGVCGGYQMLGESVSDPNGVEGPPGEIEGLKLLDVATRADRREDAARRSKARASRTARRSAAMRCMSARRKARTARARCFASPTAGSTARSRRTAAIAGAYVHGLFADDRQRAAWLAALGTTAGVNYEAAIERTLDALADHCEAHLDCDALLAAAR